MKELITKRLLENVSVIQSISEDEETVKAIHSIAEVIVAAYRRKKKVIFFGNGGSAADAQHLATELMGKFCITREPLAALSLVVNASSITAIGNDFSFNEVFARQIRGLGEEGDIAVGISTSGNSQNIILGLAAAKEKGLTTITFTGGSGGMLHNQTDYCVRVPSSNTARIQEGHITIGHIICELVEKTLFENLED